MKMLIFDFRESEKEFFNNNEFKDFDITFINEPLNSLTQLTEEQWNETDIISVFISSSVTEDVIHKFKNLRIIATRSTGYDHIDIQCCAGKNIAVFNVDQYGQKAQRPGDASTTRYCWPVSQEIAALPGSGAPR